MPAITDLSVAPLTEKDSLGQREFVSVLKTGYYCGWPGTLHVNPNSQRSACPCPPQVLGPKMYTAMPGKAFLSVPQPQKRKFLLADYNTCHSFMGIRTVI